MLLADPAYVVPPPGPPGPFGTLAWLRATVSRFSEGETHARRRAIVEALLAELDPAQLRERARRADYELPKPYIPVAVLAEALGATDVPAAVEAVRTVAAAYHPGTDAPGADDALRRLLALLPDGEPEHVAQRVAILVQACEATAALVRGALERPVEEMLRETPPVPVTRRLSPAGEVVTVPLAGHPFGAGPRRCPGEAHARALVEGVVG